jgi:transformation/transcription domain-associated protein
MYKHLCPALSYVVRCDVFVQQEFHRKVDCVDYQHWKEPKLIVKTLLHFFCHHPNDIDLLFQLLRALCERFIPDFQVLHRTVSLS